MPEFDYKRRIGVKEIAKFSRKSYLSLVGGIIGRNIDGNKVTNVGHYFKEKNIRFIINETYIGSGERNKRSANIIYTNFITDFKLQENDIVRIHFDTDNQKPNNPFSIDIEVPIEREEVYKKFFIERNFN